ncbi:hypothetical protein WL29_22775 [Burkholderia ubonensis]|uniref:Uncharacterized protein n=1 Tax=Burkholderia ubonensis TaxID=101571 RepID=A0A106QDA1_9BURK|nr:hypothetical protein [Burkholderia ubonensis]KWA84188.1 hypothetical protein WL29_22775 [Burkholderia ubonensis]
MEALTTEQRRARIQELEAELARLRAEEAADPAAAEQYLETVWNELRLACVMSKDAFRQLVTVCRTLKQTSSVRAAQHFCDYAKVPMAQAIPIINRL